MQEYKNNYNLTATPEIDSGFYFDLVAKSVAAVQNMKTEGAWPDMTYSKCSEYKYPHTKDPTERNLDLWSALKVFLFVHSIFMGEFFPF